MPSLSEMLKIKIKEKSKDIPKKNIIINLNKITKNKTLCIISNPTERSKQSWFYNIFLGNIAKKKPDRKYIKVNWIIELTGDEIKLLKEKTCMIIKIIKGE